MKYNLLYIIPLALALTACGGKKEDTAPRGPEPVSVAEVVTDSVVLHKTYPGWVDALVATPVVARVNGVITSIDYAPGAFVQKGQLLFTIESTKYRDAVEQAAAQLASAKSQYEYAKDHYAALQQAAKADAVSQMEVLQGKSAMEQAQASIRNCEAALQIARTNLSYCTVRAPHKGNVAVATPALSEYVNGEASPVQLTKIYDNSVLNAKFNIEDEQYLKMLAGRKSLYGVDLTRVPINFEGVPRGTFHGDLSYQAPAIDKETGTLRLQCTVQNPEGILKEGMYASIDLPYGDDPHAMLVRDDALGADQLGKYLYVVNDSNRVVYTPVKVGEIVRDSMRVVTSGVKPGQKYVTKALLKVRDGMEVKPIMGDPARPGKTERK